MGCYCGVKLGELGCELRTEGSGRVGIGGCLRRYGVGEGFVEVYLWFFFLGGWTIGLVCYWSSYNLLIGGGFR